MDASAMDMPADLQTACDVLIQCYDEGPGPKPCCAPSYQSEIANRSGRGSRPISSHATATAPRKSHSPRNIGRGAIPMSLSRGNGGACGYGSKVVAVNATNRKVSTSNSARKEISAPASTDGPGADCDHTVFSSRKPCGFEENADAQRRNVRAFRKKGEEVVARVVLK